jgi:hypothetical protein
MARLLTAGFETQALTLEGLVDVSGSSNVATTPHGGVRCLSAGTNAGATFAFTGTLGRAYFGRGYFNFAALPNGIRILKIVPAGANGAEVRVTAGGKVQLWNNPSAVQIGSDSVATLTTGVWYRIELKIIYNSAGSDDTAVLLLDGVTVASASGQSITVQTPGSFEVYGGAAATLIDDLALNDDQGANQNTYPGDGEQVLLLPISDNAKGTGWTNDAASTTNLFNSVDNTPPIGIADTSSGTGLNQLRNATSNANSNYDANLTTYTTAGIGAADTINVLDPIVATAAPVTTSSKQGTVGVSANPVIANVALSATGTSGAFWAGATAGTYAVGWKTSHGTVTYAPSVTLGSSPVLRITQVTSSTRIAMVCFMGMYVDYTPAVVTQVPYTNPMPPLIAQ